MRELRQRRSGCPMRGSEQRMISCQIAVEESCPGSRTCRAFSRHADVSRKPFEAVSLFAYAPSRETWPSKGAVP